MALTPDQLSPEQRAIYEGLTSDEKPIYLDLADDVRAMVGIP